jgi:hypothetical protein
VVSRWCFSADEATAVFASACTGYVKGITPPRAALASSLLWGNRPSHHYRRPMVGKPDGNPVEAAHTRRHDGRRRLHGAAPFWLLPACSTAQRPSVRARVAPPLPF